MSSAAEALAAIKELPEPPADGLILKIWRLAQLGYDEASLLQAIELLRRVGWSTNSTEQGHSAASAIVRFHRGASGTTMQIRSVLHQCRALFAPTSEEKRLERANAKLRRLQTKNPNKIGAKAALVGELLDIAARGTLAVTHDSHSRAKKVVARSGAIWRSLSRDQRDVFAQKSLVLKAEKQALLDAALADAAGEVREGKEAVASISRHFDGPCKLSSCRLTSSQLQQFDGLWASPGFSRTRLSQWRSELDEALGPLPLIQQEALLQVHEGAQREVAPVHQWMVEVAGSREHLRHCVLRMQDGEDIRYLKFLFATLSPAVSVAFIEMISEQQDDVLAALALHGNFECAWANGFWFSPGGFVFTDDKEQEWPVDPLLHVLEDLAFVRGHRVCSEADWVPWGTFVARYPLRRRRGSQQVARNAAGPPDRSMLLDFPWMQDLLDTPAARPPPPRDHSAGHAHDGSEESEGDEGFDRDEALAALATARAVLCDVHDDDFEHFSWTLRGGAWTKMHMGRDYDSFRASFSTSIGKAFLEKHGLPLSATFAVSRYGEHCCRIFCQYWVSRMRFFRGLALMKKAGQANAFCEEVIGTFVEPPEFVELVSDAPKVVLDRAEQLRSLRPS